jgi:hypothetical protein
MVEAVQANGIPQPERQAREAVLLARQERQVKAAAVQVP